MSGSPDPSSARTAIRLADEGEFRLGLATVRPPISEVVSGALRVRLQPRVMQVLVALTRAGGEVVSRDELIDRCWGGLAVGDDALNRCIQRLRRLSEQAPQTFVIETLPRVGYRLTACDAELCPLQPPQVACLGDDKAPGAGDKRRTRGWRGWRDGRGVAAIAVGLVAVAGVGALLEVSQGRPSHPPGVALRPFEVADSAPLARTFASGVAYDVANALSNADVKVIGADAPQGRRDATLILGGQAAQPDANLHFTAELEDASDHAVLWSASFTRASNQTQAMQAQVAAKIADVLHCALDSFAYPGRRIDPDTLKLYLRACDLIRTEAGQSQVVDLFRQITARQPTFSLAWSQLAVATIWASYTLPPEQAAAARAQAGVEAQRALSLNPRDAFAYVALADISLGPRLLAQHYDVLQRGLAVAPENSELDYQEGELLERLGRVDEAVRFERRAAELDPFSPNKVAGVAYGLTMKGEFDAALAALDRPSQVWPDDDDLKAMRLFIEVRYGDAKKALALLNDPQARPASESEARLASDLALVRARQTSDPASTRAFVSQELEGVRSGRLVPGDAVADLTIVGAVDAAFQAATAATDWEAPFTTADPLDPEGFFGPSAAGFRRDPRFMPLVAKIGLLAFWRKTGKWPDFCLAPDRPYDCKTALSKPGPP